MTRADWLAASDDLLRQGCDEDFYRASGPGGQKRNKTESAVRLRHRDTGLIVVANESRLREENRNKALKRLREALALRWREPLASAAPTSELNDAVAQEFRLSARHPRFLFVAAELLDQLEFHRARLSELAATLGAPTAHLVRFLKTTDSLWEAAQHLRDKHGLPNLKQ